MTIASRTDGLMKAVVQERYGSPDGLHLREIPRPVLEDDCVLVRVRAASVNASDWHLMGRLPHLIVPLVLGRRAPRVRGSDLAGYVEAVGKGVTRWKPGDEVFGGGRGTFAEYVIAPENRLAPKPRSLSFEQAAALPGAGCTALQALRDHARLRPGQRVLVYGAGGGVGTFAVQVAKALGAHVTAVTATANLDLVRSIGADEAIDYTKEDFTTRGQKYNVIVDVGGRSPAELERALEPNGALVLISAAGVWGMVTGIARALAGRRKTSGRMSFIARIEAEDLIALTQMADTGHLVPVVDRTYPLSEVPDALRRVGSRKARGKVVIEVAER